MLFLFFFFFQAEDGIRDADVTGVQTCALPIWRRCATGLSRSRRPSSASSPAKCAEWSSCSASRSADRPPWRRRQVVVLLVRASLWLMWAGESGDRALLPRVRRRAWTGPADATGGAAVH